MITRCVDELGRVVIPKEFRKALHMDTGCPVDITIENDSIRIKASTQHCVLCYNNIEENSSLPICKDCISKIKNM